MMPMEAAWRVLKGRAFHNDEYLAAAKEADLAVRALEAVEDTRYTWEEIAPLWERMKTTVTALGQLKDAHYGTNNETERLGGAFARHEAYGEENDQLSQQWWHDLFNPTMIDDDLRAGRYWESGEQ